jgi:signal transduction histidine kinase
MAVRRKTTGASTRRQPEPGGRLQQLVDAGDTRELARRAMTLQTVMLDLHRQLAGSRSQAELARTMALALTGSFACERLAVLRRDRAGRRFESVAEIGDVPATLHEEAPLLAARVAPVLPHVAPLTPLLPAAAESIADATQRLVELGFERAAWLNVEKQVDWLVLVGPKLTRAAYDEFDTSLLRATFDATALACSRLLLVDTLEERNRELQAANRRLLQIDELKSAILHGVGDELRTPLARALSYAEALRDDEVSAADTRRFLDVIVNNTRHLGTRINEALGFARLVSGESRPQPQRVWLPDLVHAVALQRRPDADALGLRIDTAAAPLAVLTDVAYLRQVIDCLVDNALKFTPAGGAIEILAEPHGAGAAVHVRDTGAGIPEDARDRIWRLFETGDLSLAREQRGLGLGLALAKRLATDIGAEIELLRSDASGSLFAVLLPEAAASPATHVAIETTAGVMPR